MVTSAQAGEAVRCRMIAVEICSAAFPKPILVQVFQDRVLRAAAAVEQQAQRVAEQQEQRVVELREQPVVEQQAQLVAEQQAQLAVELREQLVAELREQRVVEQRAQRVAELREQLAAELRELLEGEQPVRLVAELRAQLVAAPVVLAEVADLEVVVDREDPERVVPVQAEAGAIFLRDRFLVSAILVTL